jgi:hypothetical protein
MHHRRTATGRARLQGMGFREELAVGGASILISGVGKRARSF